MNQKISKYRSEVLEKSINIESLINAIISQHYFQYVNMGFVFDFLYDSYCSFGLKKKVLYKIVPNFNEKERLNRLNNIRNLFAHCNQEIFYGSEIPSEDRIGVIPDPKNTSRNLDFEELYKEFVGKEPLVAKALNKIYDDLGGVSVVKIDKKAQ